MKKSTHKRLTAWLLTLALVVTLLPGMGMTALAVEDESTGPPAVTAPTDPVDPIDPVDPVDPFDPVDPVDPTDSVDPVDPIDPVDPEPPKPPEEPEPSGEPLAPPVMKAPMRAASLTAAANGIPGATSVFVDDGKSFYDGAGNQNQLYYKNGDEADKFKGTVDDYNAHYDPDTGVLTLKGYAGGRISVGGTAKADIIIELVGENIVNGSVSCDMGGDITIKGSGSLKVTNAENGNGDVCGIAAGYGNLPTGNVTIAGSANVTINAANHYNGSRLAYGIFARQSITISDSASVDITCSAPNSTASRSSCYGMYVSPSTSGGRVTIDTAGDIQIKATDAGSEAYSCGVSAPNYTLTEVGSMEVQWKEKSDTVSGAPFTGSASFDTNTHAVNVDPTNCYASYRSGTPHIATVTGGYLTGPGVKNERSFGNFLAGDTVNLTAPTKYADSANTVEIPFDKWVSNDVTITNENSQAASFTMPNDNVAVRANYNPFATRPSFIKDSSYAGKGTIPLKLISENFDSTGGGINIYRASDLTKVNSSYIRSGTQITITVFETYCPKGEYVVGVSYGGAMCYSEPFTVKYTTPSASVAEEVIVSGSAGTTITNADVTVTLENDTFASSLSGEWIQNLPAGLSQSVTRTGDQTATITISGTPLVASTEDMKITIPAGALVEESNTPVEVSVGGKAKFAITSNAPAADKIQIGDGSNNKFSAENLYYKNGENGAKGTFSSDPSDYNAKYDPATGTLTLNGYDGPYIRINGDASQTVTFKLMGGTNNTVKGSYDPAIQLADNVNLFITSDEAANLKLDVTDENGIGTPRGSNNTGSVTIMGKSTVAINVSLRDQSYSGIRSGKDVAVLGNASLKITCGSDGNAKKGYGIFTPSGKVTVDTTGTVDIDVSGCANSDTYCISASSIEFKNAEKITLKYVPKSAGWSLSKPTYGTLDASGMKTPATDPDPVVGGQLTTVTYAKKGLPPAPPTISAYSFEFYQNQTVTLTCDTSGTTIYYTTDGSDPTTSGTRTAYTDPFLVRNSCTVKAVAYSAEDEQYSAVAEAVFTRKPVSITVVGGGKAYSDPARTIEITQAEPGTTVYLKAPAETDDGTKVFSDWSSTAKIINKESCDSAYFVMPATQPTITASYKPKPAGVTVSGTAVSWNNKDNALYYIYPTTMSDADIRAQWKTGGTVSGYSYTGTKGGITQNADGKRYDQTFRFDSVPAGTYKLVIFKPDKYVPKIVEITVSTSDYNCGEQKLWLYGDVNYDGVADGTDAVQIKRFFAGKAPSAFTTGDTGDLNDRLLCADVNYDGAANGTDAVQIKRFFAGKVPNAFTSMK